MSSTATRAGSTLDHESTSAATALVPPPKLRRRPALVAAAIVAICLGALLAGWAWTATTNTEEVLAARHNIERGAVIEASDLVRVRLTADPALNPMPASDFATVVGQRAALDIASGGLVTPDSISAAVIPTEGSSIVGVALTPAQAPGVALQSGDHVRVIVTPAQGEKPAAGAPAFSEAEVVGVHVVDESGQLVVDLLVPHVDAAGLAGRVATGNVAIVLDSRER
ncbi:SAF domain-containing protein [Nocardioides sp.]|uniref:Putative membrane protein n=1 Tax=metagenome TaxID=256318 RepID=A0A2P2BX95_9ZZZZ